MPGSVRSLIYMLSHLRVTSTLRAIDGHPLHMGDKAAGRKVGHFGRGRQLLGDEIRKLGFAKHRKK